MLNLDLGEHKDFEVYSCHVSPDGKRLATAGGGLFDALFALPSDDAILTDHVFN